LSGLGGVVVFFTAGGEAWAAVAERVLGRKATLPDVDAMLARGLGVVAAG
jgi:hypothetical protein